MDTIIQVLKKDDRLVSEEGVILKNKVSELAFAYDERLISLLYSKTKLRKQFFVEMKDKKKLVFKVDDFVSFINKKEFLPNSFTKFKNRIGLQSGGEYLKDKGEVVLAFPYKDCVLEGGQDKEGQKREEVFYNEVLAPDEIDRLFEPKVFTKFGRINKSGEEKIKEINAQDNLIIKGNNLLALHSLKGKYQNRVKLIYIDPPYYFKKKKKEDTFEYNSNFKLSTWLTFMKNRLVSARDLLSEDGSLFVQINDDGAGYLHVLLEEIFNVNGQSNFINKITVKTKSPSGFASVNAGVFETAEYIFAYAKDKKKWSFNEQYVKSEYDKNYKWFIPNKGEGYRSWKVLDLGQKIAKENGFKNKKEAVSSLGSNTFNQMLADFALKNADKVFRYTSIADNASREVTEARDVSKSKRGKIICVSRDGKYDVYVFNGSELAFYSKKIREIDGKYVPSIQLTNIWTDVPYEGIAGEGGVTLKGGKKPEKLIKRIIEIASNHGDLVMDYHIGSGTTVAVCHKLGRQYIGIEQLDKQLGKTLKRLNNVLIGEASGISKSVKWKGGGSFVYCELKEWNERYIEELKGARDNKDIHRIYNSLQAEPFFRYDVDLSQFDEREFFKLSLEDQKKVLFKCIDKNHLYINYCDIDDATYRVSLDDKKLNKLFYASK